MPDRPTNDELARALEQELRTIANEGPPELRMRLLVAAHAAGLLATEGDAQETDDPQLAEAIRAGQHDHELAAIARRLQRTQT